MAASGIATTTSDRREPRLAESPAGLAPGRIVFIHQGNEARAVIRYDEVYHLVHQHVLEHVGWLGDQFGVEPDVPCPMIAGPPSGLHPPKVVRRQAHAEPRFPFPDQRRQHAMQDRFVPGLHERRTPTDVAAGAGEQGDAVIVESDALPAIAFDNREFVGAAPQVVRFALFKASGRRVGSCPHPVLLSADPLQPSDGERFDGVQSDGEWCGDGHAAVRRMHPQVEVPDAFPGHRDLDVTGKDRVSHQRALFFGKPWRRTMLPFEPIGWNCT